MPSKDGTSSTTDQMELIAQLEQEQKAFVFAPDDLSIGRMERNVQRLEAYYQYAERAAERQLPALFRFLDAELKRPARLQNRRDRDIIRKK